MVVMICEKFFVKKKVEYKRSLNRGLLILFVFEN